MGFETVPNVSGYAAANGLEGKSDDEIRDATTDQKHSIHCLPKSSKSKGMQAIQFNSIGMVGEPMRPSNIIQAVTG
jgi:hypothetical protein